MEETHPDRQGLRRAWRQPVSALGRGVGWAATGLAGLVRRPLRSGRHRSSPPVASVTAAQLFAGEEDFLDDRQGEPSTSGNGVQLFRPRQAMHHPEALFPCRLCHTRAQAAAAPAPSTSSTLAGAAASTAAGVMGSLAGVVGSALPGGAASSPADAGGGLAHGGVGSPGSGGSSGSCHALATVGSRQWGAWWAGSSLLRVKIYDFAVYMDAQQAQQSQLARTLRERGAGGAAAAAGGLVRQPQFYRQLRSANDVDMSLVVRASRNLPIRLMAKEYERILRRRLAAVGGSPREPALDAMLAAFDEAALPASVRHGACVKKGTLLAFTKDRQGNLCASANGQQLAAVRSPKLCEAVFDLYLGDNPVSKAARSAGGASFIEMAAGRFRQPVTGGGGGCAEEGEACRLLSTL